MLILSCMLTHLLAPDALLRKPSSTLSKVRHGILLVAHLIHTGFFLFFSLGEGLAWRLGPRHPISMIEVGSIFTACVQFSLLFFQDILQEYESFKMQVLHDMVKEFSEVGGICLHHECYELPPHSVDATPSATLPTMVRLVGVGRGAKLSGRGRKSLWMIGPQVTMNREGTFSQSHGLSCWCTMSMASLTLLRILVLL